VTAATGSTRPGGAAGPGRTRHVLLRDELGRLSLRRLRPWHRVLARGAAARLDRQLAAGTSPETSVALAARAIQLTSMTCRRDLAASVQRILAAAGDPPAVIPSRAAAGPPPRLQLSRAQISQLTGPLARLAGCLAAPGPVPAQAAALASQLLADGAGPLYHRVRGDDLTDLIENLTQARTR
jgi:hypothetical protein